MVGLHVLTMQFSVLHCLIFSSIYYVEGVVPSGILRLHYGNNNSMLSELCAPSTRVGWGQMLPVEETYYGKLFSPATRLGQDSQGCTKALVSYTSDVPLVDRGGCSFLKKAQNAQEAGAKALIVRGTRKATYESIIKTYSQKRVKNPKAFDFFRRPHFEYDCSRGESNVTTIKDPIWDTDDSYCSQSPSCHSKMCIPTGVNDSSDGDIPKYQLCCLWDTHILIGANNTLAKNISIPVAYVTIEEGLLLEKEAVAQPRVYLLQRPHQLANWSSIVLWLIGVLTAVGASFYSLSHKHRSYIAPENIDIDEIEHSHLSNHDQYEYLAEDVQEIDGASAVGFVICAGSFLILLYYFDIGRLFPIIFGLSAMGSLYSVMCMPLLHLLLPYLSTWRCNISSISRYFVVTVGLLEVLGVLGSVTITFLWYLYRIQCWYLQDILGIVLCCSFLKNIKVPNLRVATILLSLAFVYDIFFVFISPYIFGSNVMERVATGGAPANTRIEYPGIDFCERYPHYAPCKDPQPLPMLLLMPQFDWRGGFTMLGLGDIIVPGLLISLGLRFDCCLAKSKYATLSGKLRQIPGETKVYTSLLNKPSAAQNRWQVQYYITASIAFAVGLGMANTAVSFSGVGQPALMYLVPCTLGATILRAWMNNELKLFWLEFEHDFEADVQGDIRETTFSP